MLPYAELTSFQIGPVTVYTWGLLVALGFVVGVFLLMRFAKEENIEEKEISSLFLWTFIASMIGSRLFYVLLFWSSFSDDLFSMFKIWDGGMVFFGGLIGAIPVVMLFAKKRLNIGFWKLADLLAPALAMGLAVGRIGCSLINDHPGSQTAMPWGIAWPDDVLRHPVAVYLVLLNLILFILLLLVRKRVKNVEGAVAWIYFAGYGVGRFFLDFTRATDLSNSDPRFWGLTISQYVSIILVLLAISFFVRSRRSSSSA